MKSLVLFALLAAAACARGGATRPQAPERMSRTTSAVTTTAAPPRTLNLITLGDSLAYGTGDETDRGIASRIKGELKSRGVAEVTTLNLGINGAQTTDLQARLRQPRLQQQLASADAIVLSIGANDLFRTPAAREESLRAPLLVAERILNRLQEIVAELHRINPHARILLLGGYNPVPGHQWATQIDRYLDLWDQSLAGAFEDDPLVAIVKMDDIVTADRLSRYDHFHPGGAAYEAASRRIAAMLVGG